MYVPGHALQNSFAKHLLDGKSLPYNFHGLYSLKATVTSPGQYNLPIIRGFTRLSTVYFSFTKQGAKENSYHPLEGAIPTDAIDLFKYNMTLGSDRYPPSTWTVFKSSTTNSGSRP